MATEDRVRDALRRVGSAPHGASVEHLWGAIERGVARAHRRQVANRVAAAGVSLVVAVGAVALVAVAFRGSRVAPGTEHGNLEVRDVRVLPASGGVAKVTGFVTNNGEHPAGAQVRCTVLDTSGTTLGTAAGSVAWVDAGASTRFALGGRYRSAPSAAHCTATFLAAVSPKPAGGAAFHPLSIAFWDADNGLMTGVSGQPACSPECQWDIQVTHDGGQSWHEVERGAGEMFDVAILPQPVEQGCGFGCGVSVGRSSWAWALQGPCAMGTCTIDVLYSGDGGETWTRRATTDLKQISFVSATDGWGIGDVSADGQLLASTTDGGRTWRRQSVPCPSQANIGTDVSFVSPDTGWLLCTGPGGAGSASRAVLETTDGGRTWTTVAQAMMFGSSSGGLTTDGYPQGIFFLGDGHGWMWSGRAPGLWATTDGGKTWRLIGQDIANGASTMIGGAWFITDSTGFAFLTNGDARATQLIRTDDGGRTWHVIHSWPQ